MKKIVLSSIIALFIVGIITLSACSVSLNSNVCLTGKDIPADIKTQVEQLNDQVAKAIKAKDTNTILSVAGSEISNKSDSLKTFIESQSILMAETPKLMDEYYLTFSQTGTTNETITPTPQNPPYYFYVQPISTKMMVLFSTFDKGFITYILAQTYALESDKWNLEGLKITDYAYNGMNAPALYNKAANYQKNNNIIPAALYSSLLTKLMQPANMISYPNTDEMVKFQTDINNQAHKTYVFPFSLKAGQKTYSVVDLVPMLTDKGITCSVKYVTDTPLQDTSQIEAEAKAVEKVLDNYFPGLTDSMNAFLMQAYNDIPSDPTKTYDCYSTPIVK